MEFNTERKYETEKFALPPELITSLNTILDIFGISEAQDREKWLHLGDKVLADYILAEGVEELDKEAYKRIGNKMIADIEDGILEEQKQKNQIIPES